MKNRKKTYENRIRHFERFLNTIQKKFNGISKIRTVSFLLSLFCYYLGQRLGNAVLFNAVSLIFLFVFIAGIFIHSKMSKILGKVKTLLQINQEGLLRMQDKWTDFHLTGEEFLDSNLSYIIDLNILGKNSLFQMIQLTSTNIGAKQLANWLTGCNDFSVLPSRQLSIKEICPKLSLRQHLLMEGRILGKPLNPTRFLGWVKSPSFLTGYGSIPFLHNVLVLTTLLLIGLRYFLGIPSFWMVTIAVQTGIVLFTAGRCQSHYKPALNRDSVFLSYERMFALIEGEGFDTPYLKDLQSKLYIHNKPVSLHMKRLKRINSSLCLCYSSIHFFINILFLWDIYFLYTLEKWKEEMAPAIEACFDVLGECEALSSLGGFSYDNPDYTIASITNEEAPLIAEELGHPLITADERVYNDFLIPSEGFLGLITGSNMSGKSTFIRTIGINIHLAFAGAAVAARKFIIRPCKVMTCIDVHDSLSNHTSHFYAEVLGIKKIYNAVCPKEKKQPFLPVLYLIDEIFSGTNTKERLIASSGIILKLTTSKSYGLLTTHDLDLADLSKKSQLIKNFHFQDKIDEQGKMYFDYRILNGPIGSTNALKILKLEGIDISI